MAPEWKGPNFTSAIVSLRIFFFVLFQFSLDSLSFCGSVLFVCFVCFFAMSDPFFFCQVSARRFPQLVGRDPGVATHPLGTELGKRQKGSLGHRVHRLVWTQKWDIGNIISLSLSLSLSLSFSRSLSVNVFTKQPTFDRRGALISLYLSLSSSSSSSSSILASLFFEFFWVGWSLALMSWAGRRAGCSFFFHRIDLGGRRKKKRPTTPTTTTTTTATTKRSE